MPLSTDEGSGDQSYTQPDGSARPESMILPPRVYDEFNPNQGRRQEEQQSRSTISVDANKKYGDVNGGVHQSSQPSAQEDVSSGAGDVWAACTKHPLHGTPASYNWDEDDDTRKSNQPGLGGSTSPSSPK